MRRPSCRDQQWCSFCASSCRCSVASGFKANRHSRCPIYRPRAVQTCKDSAQECNRAGAESWPASSSTKIKFLMLARMPSGARGRDREETLVPVPVPLPPQPMRHEMETRLRIQPRVPRPKPQRRPRLPQSLPTLAVQSQRQRVRPLPDPSCA
jgi:hypothetical protein